MDMVIIADSSTKIGVATKILGIETAKELALIGGALGLAQVCL
jgi:hypothetical protein